jgi:hypothetical protein
MNGGEDTEEVVGVVGSAPRRKNVFGQVIDVVRHSGVGIKESGHMLPIVFVCALLRT